MATIYGFIVDGVEVETGFRLEHNTGEMVNVAVEWKYNKWNKVHGNADSFPAATKGGPGGGQVKSFGGGGGGFKPASRGKFPVEPTDGQMSIIRQNSMNRAVEILTTWTGSGLFTPKTEEEYMHKLMEVAVTVTDFNSGQDIMKMQAALQANREAYQ
jgi:hypothetical protein